RHVHAYLQVLECPRYAERGQCRCWGAHDLCAIQAYAACIGCVDTRDEIEQSRLAGTVGADYRKYDAGRDAELHVLHGMHTAERFTQIGYLQQGHVQPSFLKRAASVGTKPLGTKIMQPTRITP